LSDDPKPTWIPRETWRQEKAVVFARDAIVGPHIFMAHDRSRAKSSKEHLWQAKRGVRKGTPDTQLILPGGLHAWFEFKAPGQRVASGDDQDLMLAKLRSLGDEADWGVTIEDMRAFWAEHNVPMVPNAAYRAMVLDGLVDSRIAKAEGAVPVVKKAARPGKVQPRFTAGKRMARRIYAG
jgi:hypothetical protein